MRERRSVFDDPVVQDVRRARAKLWREGGGTIKGFMRVVHRYTEDISAEQKPVERGKRRSDT